MFKIFRCKPHMLYITMWKFLQHTPGKILQLYRLIQLKVHRPKYNFNLCIWLHKEKYFWTFPAIIPQVLKWFFSTQIWRSSTQINIKSKVLKFKKHNSFIQYIKLFSLFLGWNVYTATFSTQIWRSCDLNVCLWRHN